MFKHIIGGILIGIITLSSSSRADLPANVVVYEGDRGPGKGKHIVFIASDHEYRAEETCPALARILAKRHGFKCSVIFGVNKKGFIEPGSSNIPGTEILKEADLLFIFARFLNPSDEQMKPIDAYLNRAGPVIGLRTSTHAFRIPKTSTYAKYDFQYPGDEYRLGFGRQVLGETWAGHYGPNHTSSTRLEIIPENQGHVVLTGCENLHGMAGAYAANPESNSVILAQSQPLTGMTADSPTDRNKPPMPGLWVRTYPGAHGKTGRVLATTQGTSEGILNHGFRRCLINGVFWTLGLDQHITKELNIDFVGPYKPKTFNFKGQSKDIRPASLRGFESAILPESKFLLDGSLKVAPDTKDPLPFTFQSNDVVAIIGNALPDRMQHEGWLETTLQSELVGKQVSFRNMSLSGDQVDHFPRQKGFKPQTDFLQHVKADVIFSFFGYNESFDGVEKADAYRRRLVKMVKTFRGAQPNGESFPRFVLFSPIAFETTGDPNLPDGKEQNLRLAAYAEATRLAAAESGVQYVDLYTPTLHLFAESDARMTVNGAHLNEEGHRRLAGVIATSLLGKPIELQAKQDPFEAAKGKLWHLISTWGRSGNYIWEQDALRFAVKDKNWHWHNRYRAVDGNDIWGSRSRIPYAKGQNNAVVLQHEMSMFDILTANRDQKVWAVAEGKKATVDDSNVPAPIPVVSNVGGGSRTSSAQKEGDLNYLSAEESLKRIDVPEGYTLNVFASEELFPDLANPVQMQVDGKGRLWVASWNTYPKWEPSTEMKDSLLIFEDVDHDGVADKQIRFARVHSPTGFEFWNGGVLVVSGPDLLFLKDTDGDDIADVRTVMLAGIGTADSHHSANNLKYGPDGGIYWQSGIFQVNNFETPWSRNLWTGASGLYRFDPRRSTIHFLAGNGANPHGTSFDYWGYCYVNDGAGGQPRQLRSTEKGFLAHELLKKEVRPVPGNLIVSSLNFPDDVQENFAVCNVIGFLGLKTYKLHRDGFENPRKKVGEVWGTPTEDLFVSHDRNVRPTGAIFGEDGALYISDWHNVIIGHLQHSIRDPNRDNFHGRIIRMTYTNRPLQNAVAIDGQPIPALLENLKHPVNGVRHRTRVELSERNTGEVLEAARTWANGFDPAKEDEAHHLLEALWLHQQHNVRNEDLLNTLLESPIEHARIAARMVKHFWSHVGPESGSLAAPKKKKKKVSVPKHLPRDDVKAYQAGAEVFSREAHCATCHQPNGMGMPNLYPPLVDTPWVLGDEERLIKLTLHGLWGDMKVKGVTYGPSKGAPPMTAFGSLLKDEEIANVLTFIRNSWGNQAPPVKAETVHRVRNATKDRDIFWKPDELLKAHPIAPAVDPAIQSATNPPAAAPAADSDTRPTSEEP
jgi:mono/diheme cytochrome c family protein